MPDMLARLIMVVLLAVHAGLVLWGLAGFAELTDMVLPWPRMSNPLFPVSMLVVQWVLVAVAGGVFIVGVLTRWPRLPMAMTVIYGAMAAVCAFQTLTILRHDSRFLDMGLEYLTYAAILVFLYRAPLSRRYFSG
jgi:hypothetical protein